VDTVSNQPQQTNHSSVRVSGFRIQNDESVIHVIYDMMTWRQKRADVMSHESLMICFF
jgi:hypothetical protein